MAWRDSEHLPSWDWQSSGFHIFEICIIAGYVPEQLQFYDNTQIVRRHRKRCYFNTHVAPSFICWRATRQTSGCNGTGGSRCISCSSHAELCHGIPVRRKIEKFFREYVISRCARHPVKSYGNLRVHSFGFTGSPRLCFWASSLAFRELELEPHWLINLLRQHITIM